MKRLALATSLLLSLSVYLPGAWANACAACEKTCDGSKTANCACVVTEGCTCCGAASGSLGAASANTSAKLCVKDSKKMDHCGEPTTDSVRKAGKDQQELKSTPKS